MTTTPAHEAEADRVELVYYYALTQLGVHTIEDSLSLWQDVAPGQAAVSSGRWLRTATKLLMKRRGRARDLAIAYYRLTRALRTGRTIADPRKSEGKSVSLEALRQEFESVVDEIAPNPAQNPLPDERTGTPEGNDTPEPVEAVTEPSLAPGTDDEQIEVDEIAELEDEADRLERDAEDEASLVLDALGPKNLESKVTDIGDERPAKEVDELRQAAHRSAGARQAAATERIAMNAARGLVYSIGVHDPLVMGWVRYSQTGTPCGWCAMLISRGVIFYSSAQAAQHQGKNQDEDKYHDNCHCVAVPVFSRDQYDKSPLYALNRQYAAEWPRVTRGRGGDAALTLWRRHIRQQQKDHASSGGRVTPPLHVQEA